MLTGMNTRVGSIATLLSAAGVQQATNTARNRTRTPQQAMIQALESHEYEAPLIDSESVEDDGDEEDGNAPREAANSTNKSCKVGCCDSLTRACNNYRPKQTPLQESLHNLGILMTVFAISGAILVVLIGLFRNFRDPNNSENAPWLQSVLLGISMAVSAIPEGLPLVVTICLALGTTAMAKKNALIRRLPAVETLGSASIICSDKTGTLTTGKMTVRKIYTYGKLYSVSGDGYDPVGKVTDANGCIMTVDTPNHHALHACMHVSTLCNDAKVQYVDDKWKAIGTSTESALVVGAEKLGIKTQEIRTENSRVSYVPFSSKIKMMVSIHELHPRNNVFSNGSSMFGGISPYVVLAKGAPLPIIQLCEQYVQDDSNGTTSTLTSELRGTILAQVDALSSTGLRVLAMCYKVIQTIPIEIESDKDGLLGSEEKIDITVKNMIFCGFVGMMDPPRHGVRQAVLTAKRGGVRTVMVSLEFY